MKAVDLLNAESGELGHKLRTVSDLTRHIETMSDDCSNYNIFLGAGASVTSGVRSASELIDEWALDIAKSLTNEKFKSVEEAKLYLEKHQASWYNQLSPYSSLFEKKYDLAKQRRRFVEKEVDGKYPSIGYAYLISLIEKKFINTVFTTNFDDLINEAFYQFSNIRPTLCAHDSSIKSISIAAKRPKIIKIHGDYLFDDIKSTLKETESLEQNTKEKLMEFCKEFGLIVVGYSGSDRSVMDVLDFLTKQENYLTNGVYWCMRKDDQISLNVRNLLWREKVYPVLIDGFDELFAEMHKKLAKEHLNLKPNKEDSRVQKAIEWITKDSYNLKRNESIKSDLEAIDKDLYSQDLSRFISDLSKNNETRSLSFTDMRNLLEIECSGQQKPDKKLSTLFKFNRTFVTQS